MKRWSMGVLIAVLLVSIAVPFFTSPSEAKGPGKKQSFKLGVEVLLEDELQLLEGKKVGLITNPTGVNQELKSIVDIFNEHKAFDLVSLYGPEHGVRGDAQAGQHVEFYIDQKTGLPVYSLYGPTKKPTPEMLKGVEVLVFDIQDVGTRFYTYIYTMAYAMEAAKENNIPIVVLDRPNPLGGQKIEGPVLQEEYTSFVGMYPIPIRHGMTVGELAQLFNQEFNIGADLNVVKMKGWKRSMTAKDLPTEWVAPSPNMPTADTALVYPGASLIEGTNVSEGRGTTKPFETIGAPFINGGNLAEELNKLALPGVTFRPSYFTPSFSKHSGKLSGGIEIHVINESTYEPVKTGVAIVKTIHDLYPNHFAFNAGNKPFFDLLAGNNSVRESIESGKSIQEIVAEWKPEINEFQKLRKGYLLYK
ncbi:DUF1343 domain-containing protein [Priestia flexa]|uniref:DUF1343 domain-containing protein n=1 Tax=Priestia veravalensis TaxID=1414648 RepID=A0A0V8JJM5_9BACI|nr:MULTISPECIES: DUF1343 domain-containing protein [Bacillaceae]AQX54289.1 hypothetical protein BC359_08210 [Priestia flexa]KSU87255.1 hypothetical protein AS180_14230 [Priestia veravalensis]KZB90111.1 hypothetical protein A2U94_17805 [Bacillus sp. VT 712]MBY6087240.1 DUF1343 domain-containing protein [Priestia flexa]MCA1203903.1 DUF1343 domain-containing protein [Priestia flexa]